MKGDCNKIYVVGHTNPDTDSVASAIAYSALLSEKAHPLVAGKLNKGTSLALKKFGVRCPRHAHAADFNGAGVILVDHNEEGQWPKGVAKENIIKVIDHHRVGEDFSTVKPISIRIEPVGATSTIVSKIYREKGKIPEIHVAGLLLSAILTDTLMFHSPTTTEDDKESAKWLNKYVKIDMKEHAKEIFEAKSDITNLSLNDLIKKDFKEYHFNHLVKMGISMLETLNPEEITVKRDEILSKMKQFKKRERLTHLIFVIVDIRRMKAYILPLGKKEKEVVKRAFGAKEKNGFFTLTGVVSRKKQLVPKLEEFFME